MFPKMLQIHVDSVLFIIYFLFLSYLYLPFY